MVKEDLEQYEKKIIEATGDKYQSPGIYSISVNNHLVYIGKSKNMVNRIANHMYHIDHKDTQDSKAKKYRFLRAIKEEYPISFDVVEYGEEGDDIGNKEALWINKLEPILNLQIPKLDNYHSCVYSKRARDLGYKEFREYCGAPV